MKNLFLGAVLMLSASGAWAYSANQEAQCRQEILGIRAVALRGLQAKYRLGADYVTPDNEYLQVTGGERGNEYRYQFRISGMARGTWVHQSFRVDMGAARGQCHRISDVQLVSEWFD